MADQVDHIKPINQGGEPYDWSNLQSLCQHCHSTKTMTQDRGLKLPSGVDPETGLPVGGDHWWND